ncbi:MULTISPECIES: substrate-binding domain-containing protein [Algibacter]|uniref:Monosaccharide ABC transporter substrate-binding protein (CUT2 family) n=1 Tax=Algibacter lectus TaxID=221126 RepID=A0A090WMC9_9FLAO|nr:substrate-binding domain-containing protein [Algibacter lectus]MDO7137681.1 substrate-binding domain-containing protein [Algibacter lectus]MWW25565.1 substrate-binding domain-containing protein [Algibacter lectus]TDY61511.1 monosaccharide ABC transporter substrate-binding protein (CUT2 family) [Algibacter lectus]SFD12285.1 monosaccharide ABC transporter substrate-binding protein, CUT2 family [Algibacter lectus]GAL78245.1 ribose ABC transport system periplasmic ribose-binding protein RbsB [A
MKTKNKTSVLKQCLKPLMVLALIFNLSSCVEQTGSTSATVNSAEDTGVTVASNVDLTGMKIGYCTPSLNAPYYQALLQSIKANTEKNGMVFLSADGQDDINKQVAAVEDLITKGVDALLLNPKDPDALVGVTRAAKAAGIPVFIIDSSINPSADYVTTIQSNNLANGELAGEWLVKKMGNKTMNIALLSGNAGNPVGRTRKQGLLQGITEEQLRTQGKIDLNVKTQAYTEWSYAGGLKAMEDILVAHPDINVVITESDVCVLGAIKAIAQAGKTDDILIVAGADGQKEAIKYIMDTDFYGCTAMNSPVQIGKNAVQYAIEYINGKRDFQKTSFTAPLLITKENAAKYYDPKALF